MYVHESTSISSRWFPTRAGRMWHATRTDTGQKQTKNTWHRSDPSFTYLLSFFLLLTALAWGLAYADGVSRILRITLVFIFGHFLATSLLVSTAAYFLVGKFLGPGIAGWPGRRRQGLFGPPGNQAAEQLEFGYCFDVGTT